MKTSDKYLKGGLFTLFAAAVVIMYLLSSWKKHGMGFPLDDAWIHQVYARNLAEYGRWFFQEGKASTGSTAPLWTVLLVPGYLAGFSPVLWSAMLGTVLLAGTALAASGWMETSGEKPIFAWAAGLTVLFEWHLGWAAVSGMETIAAVFWVLLVLSQMFRNQKNPFLIGALIGLGVWIRPDLVTLLLPFAMVSMERWKNGLRNIFAYYFAAGAGLMVFVVPYLLLNEGLSGEFWPTTFYAKQAEYSAMRQISLALRFIEQYRQPLIGAGGVLLPGVINIVYRHLKDRNWAALAPLVWVLAYLSMFAIRLPVVYQHGRYAMPAAAVVIVLGVQGMLHAIQLQAQSAWKRVLSRAWLVSSVLVLAAFTVIGSSAYADDVRIIETEMVATAKWIQHNTNHEDLIAVHDIGAVGYYSERRLVDLAGLISPEVIPILRDEEALAVYITDKQVDYLVTFPSWYPELVRSADLVFQTESVYSVDAGGENMAVYRWGGEFAH